MTLLENIVKQVASVTSELDSEKVNKTAFETAGVVIVRNVLSEVELANIKQEWQEYYQHNKDTRNINSVNPVDYSAPIPDTIEQLRKHPKVLDNVQQLIGDNIGVYGTKLFVKDNHSAAKVFLHQDYPYQHGNAEKVSMFMALNNVTKASGALNFYLGTHKFGYIGDAGELKEQLLPDNWPVLHVDMKPGDMALMHCMTWHDSPENKTKEPRVVFVTTFQDAEDISSKEVVRGERSWQNIGSDLLQTPSTCFERSRSKTLKSLYQQLEQQK